jgi:hypothetical protein
MFTYVGWQQSKIGNEVSNPSQAMFHDMQQQQLAAAASRLHFRSAYDCSFPRVPHSQTAIVKAGRLQGSHFGYNPHVPQAIMNQQMGASVGPRSMPGMMPAGTAQPDMAPQAAQPALSRSPHSSKSSMHHETKESSDKSSGNDSHKTARRSEAPRSAKSPHFPRNLPRPTSRSASKSRATPCSPHQGVYRTSSADVVALVRLDGASTPTSKAYRHAPQPPSSNGGVRRCRVTAT